VDKGYVVLWRKMLDSPIMQNSQMFHFFGWCLLKASHKNRKQMVGYKEVWLDPGELIFSRKMASQDTGISEQSIRTILTKLEKMKMVQKSTSKSTNKFSVINIINWGTYQNIKNQSTSKLTNNQPATNQQLTSTSIIKNVKHVKHVKKKSMYTKKESGCDPEIEKFVSGFMEHIQDTYPNLAPKGQQSFLTGCEVVDKLIRLDGFKLDYIVDVMRFAVQDDYSAKYNTSLATLRTKKNGASDTTKFQKVAMAYENKQKQSITISPNEKAAIAFLNRRNKNGSRK